MISHPRWLVDQIRARVSRRYNPAAKRALQAPPQGGGPTRWEKEPPQVFSRGYLIAAQGHDPDHVPDGWAHRSCGGYEVWHDRRLPAAMAKSEEGEQAVLILGSVVDSQAYSAELGSVARRLAQVLNGADGFSKLDELVTWLGGRYVILAVNQDRARIHVDATASRSCFWSARSGKLVAGSHSALVAKVVGNVAKNGSNWVLTNPQYQSPSGKWLPGAMAPHDVVSLVVANCCLDIGPQGIRHQRFFPGGEYRHRNLPTRIAAAEVSKELQIQFELGLHTGSEVYFGLTSGSDSKALLDANLPRLRELGATTFTYHSFEKNPRHSREDALAAQRIAKEAGLRHQVFDLCSSESLKCFRRKYYQTFTGWARFPALAETFYRELPEKSQIVLAIGPEIGTVFYKERDPSLLTAAGFAGKYTQSPFANNPELIRVFERYIRYTDLDLSPAASFSAFDLFYWESRLSNWAAAGYSEYEMAADVVLPFNSRTVILPMLELPFEERLAKGLYDYL